MDDSVLKIIQKDVEDIKHILNGNGERGLVAKVIDHETYIDEQKKKKDDMFTAIYRAALGIGVAYICFKLGIKPA